SVRISGISDDDDERCLKREINQRIPVAAQQRDQISDDSESAKDVYGGWNPRPPEQDSGAEKDVDAAEDSDEKPCPCKRRRKNGIARSIGGLRHQNSGQQFKASAENPDGAKNQCDDSEDCDGAARDPFLLGLGHRPGHVADVGMTELTCNGSWRKHLSAPRAWKHETTLPAASCTPKVIGKRAWNLGLWRGRSGLMRPSNLVRFCEG